MSVDLFNKSNARRSLCLFVLQRMLDWRCCCKNWPLVLTGTSQYLGCSLDRLDYVYVVIIIFFVVGVVVVVVFKLLFGWGAGEKFVWLLWFVVYYDW